MALSIGAVGVASYLTGKGERLAMEVDVRTAVALVRWRLPWVVVPYYLSLLFLWACAALLVFCTCQSESEEDRGLCNLNGGLVVAVFVVIGGFVTAFPRWLILKDTRHAYGNNVASWRENPATLVQLAEGVRRPLHNGAPSTSNEALAQ